MKPIIILNTNGLYDPLITMLEQCISEHFMAQQHRQMWTVVAEPEQSMNAILETPRWHSDALNFATLII